MKTTSGKSLVYRAKSAISLLASSVLTLGLVVMASGQADTNRLETGGQYDIAPPPTNMMFQITNNETNNNGGDDNLVWSFSGRELAVDRSDTNAMGPAGNKYINLLDVSDLTHVTSLGARSSALTNPLFPNVTCWTYNDDRVLFGTWHHINPTNPADRGKIMLMSAATGAVSVNPFLQSDGLPNPTNHVYSPSVILDRAVNQERLLFLLSSATNNQMPNDTAAEPNARINLYTVTFNSGGMPAWSNRVALTAFNTNYSISSTKWCPELGTNYDPIANRLVILFTGANESNKIAILNNVQGIIANPTSAPTSLADPSFVILETNLTMNSQVSWTFDGQYVMFGRMSTNPGPVATDLYSKRTVSPTNPAVKFEIPTNIVGGQKQWLAISPDGMKAAFTVDKQVYVLPLQFDNTALTNQATNVLTDASYTEIDLSGAAINSNTTFSIVAPPSVDTNNLGGEYSGFAREITVSGVSSQFDLLTNASMTMHFDEDDIPSDASVTNLAIYVYNPQGTNGGQTGTWEMLASTVDTNLMNITSSNVSHFSIYTIARATIAPVTPSLSAPTGVIASDGAYEDKVNISWQTVSNATGYRLYRNESNDTASAAVIGTVTAVTTNYDDTTATADDIYYYWVKATNNSGSSAFSTPDTGRRSFAGPLIKANGKADSITVGSSDEITITVAFDVGSYPTDVSVDWWVIASANYNVYYYMDNTPTWKEAAFTGNNYSVFQPVYQGSLLDVPSTEVVPGIILPPGMYYFWFAVDYPADGVLNPNGPILYDQVTVTVQ